MGQAFIWAMIANFKHLSLWLFVGFAVVSLLVGAWWISESAETLKAERNGQPAARDAHEHEAKMAKRFLKTTLMVSCVSLGFYLLPTLDQIEQTRQKLHNPEPVGGESHGKVETKVS